MNGRLQPQHFIFGHPVFRASVFPIDRVRIYAKKAPWFNTIRALSNLAHPSIASLRVLTTSRTGSLEAHTRNRGSPNHIPGKTNCSSFNTLIPCIPSVIPSYFHRPHDCTWIGVKIGGLLIRDSCSWTNELPFRASVDYILRDHETIPF